MSKKKPAPVLFITEIQHDELRECLSVAEQAAALLRTKCMVLRTAADGGATLQSLAHKLGWTQDRLEALILRPDTDIEIRDLANIMAAMGRQVEVSLEAKD